MLLEGAGDEYAAGYEGAELTGATGVDEAAEYAGQDPDADGIAEADTDSVHGSVSTGSALGAAWLYAGAELTGSATLLLGQPYAGADSTGAALEAGA